MQPYSIITKNDIEYKLYHPEPNTIKCSFCERMAINVTAYDMFFGCSKHTDKKIIANLKAEIYIKKHGFGAWMDKPINK